MTEPCSHERNAARLELGAQLERAAAERHRRIGEMHEHHANELIRLARSYRRTCRDAHQETTA